MHGAQELLQLCLLLLFRVITRLGVLISKVPSSASALQSKTALERSMLSKGLASCAVRE